MKVCRGCAIEDLDYSEVEHGLIRCTVCPQEWKVGSYVDKDDRVWTRWYTRFCPLHNRRMPCFCVDPKQRKGLNDTKRRWE